ncbi:hypothetical protein VTI28DRAFT_4083 [Corynascus sepedonium]
MDTRGTSLPALEQFAFSQTPSLATRQTPRVSDAISPKQIPRTVPSPPPGTGTNVTEAVQSMATTTTTATMTTTASPVPENLIALDQVSCLDFNEQLSPAFISTHAASHILSPIPADSSLNAGAAQPGAETTSKSATESISTAVAEPVAANLRCCHL